MATNCCHKFLASIVKFLNFFQFFIGISTVIYSAYLLNQWQNRAPVIPSPPSSPSPPPPAPFPALSPEYFLSFHSNVGLLEAVDQIHPLDLAGDVVSGSELSSVGRLNSFQLPAPWFMYFLMVVGILLCSMSCIGHIAAEAINGCCLCFHILLTLLLMLLEAALVAFIAIDRRWERDIPFDPTGELERFKSFVEENADMCKWVGIFLLAVQALSLLLSLILRALISTQRAESDIENGYTAVQDGIREPLLNSQQNQSSGLTKSEGWGALSDIWSTRIRQKYGLNKESTEQSVTHNATPSTKG